MIAAQMKKCTWMNGVKSFIAEATKDLAAFQAQMGRRTQVILIDSCASISIVSEKFWHSTRARSTNIRPYQGAAIKVGDAWPQSVVGEGMIYFTIKGQRFEAKVIIIRDWVHDILLSIEWLREHNAIINL
jgi:hypothetical protein